MDRSEKIKGMLTLLELNDDQFGYEMTSLAVKINNFLDDRSRLLSGQWLSVIYQSLTEENDSESVETYTKIPAEIYNYATVETFAKTPVEIEKLETVETDTEETIEIEDIDLLESIIPSFDDSPFALV
jgi:hypothetical protein